MLKSSTSQSTLFKEELSLLEKKDQQIRRLQSELQQERKRADNAIKILQNYKNIQNRFEEGGDTLRNEITRRIKAEEQLKRQQLKNKVLQEGIKKYIVKLRGEAEARIKPENKSEQDDLY